MDYDFKVAVIDGKENIVAWVDDIGDAKAWELVETHLDYNFACFDKDWKEATE